ncbi:aldo/keto reductase [Streptomyces sp. NPDC001787]|uniref:aldo/keto reductase n=1 Tax=Streptomyces sp. NPDC001787 TaxID=3154523 RepID=UPI00332D4CAC
MPHRPDAPPRSRASWVARVDQQEEKAMSVEKRPLGVTGMDITTLGLGTWALGGPDWLYGWSSQDDRESIATIRRSLHAGVNWIDTAAVYGLGHSEEVIGEALSGIPGRERPFVFTKCGLVGNAKEPFRAPQRTMRADSVRREVEESLRRLRVDHIDLYQVHQPDDGERDEWQERTVPPEGVPVEEYWQTMADLKAEGKVRAIGLSNHSVQELDRAEKVAHVDAIQPPLSPIRREAAPEIEWAAARGTGVITYQALYSGLLSGAFSPQRVESLPDDDWRRTDPEFTVHLPGNLAVAETLRSIAAAHGVPVPAVAIAWVLAWPGVTGAIVGARRPGQLGGLLAADGLGLSEADLRRIAATIEEFGVGIGPLRPPAG